MERQTVIVTGATGEIGRACVKRCVNDGYNVVAFGRTMERLKEIVSERADAFALFAGDVSEAADRAAAVDLALKRFAGSISSSIGRQRIRRRSGASLTPRNSTACSRPT